MKPFNHPRTLITIASALVALSATAFAQGMGSGMSAELHAQHMVQRGTAGTGAMDPAHMAEMQKKMSERHAERLARLKNELKITASQEPAWNAYLARTANAPHKPAMAEDWSQLTTPQRLDKMQALKAERDAQMAQRIDATKSLYAALSPEQQKVFDAQGPGLQRTGMKGEHRPGGRGGHHGVGGCEGSPEQGGKPRAHG